MKRFLPLFVIRVYMHFRHHKLWWFLNIALLFIALEIAFHQALPPLGPRMLPQEHFNFPERFRCMQKSAELDYEPIPNRCGRNELGIKVTPAYTPDQPSLNHLLLLGDSLSDHGYYIEAMQKSLNSEMDSSNWQIWNTGVSGYNLTQEFRLMKKHLSISRPQLIMFQLCPNDDFTELKMVQLRYEWHKYLFDSDGNLRYWFRLISKSRMADYMFFRMYGDPFPKNKQIQFMDIKEILKEIHTISESKNIPVVFVIFPFFGSDPKHPVMEGYRKVVKYVKASGMPFFMAENALAPPLEQYRINDWDCIHPNNYAHSLIGNAVADFLLQNQLFQPLNDAKLKSQY